MLCFSKSAIRQNGIRLLGGRKLRMVRRKATPQSKRAREAASNDTTDDEQDDLPPQSPPTATDAVDEDGIHHRKRRKMKARVTYAGGDPMLRIWERVAATAGSAPMTFRNAWGEERRRDALWVNARIDVQSQAALVKALMAFEERIKRIGGDDAVVIGLEVDGKSHAITLCAKVAPAERGKRDGVTALKRFPTELTLEELFPGTFDTWTASLVHLVLHELLVFEIVSIDGPQEQDDGSDFMWRFGVALQPYMTMLDALDHVPVVPGRRAATCHRSMHHVMIWLLRNARCINGQCEYPYWQEIDVLYEQFVGSAIPGNDAPLPSVSFDIHEMCARINSSRQLQRDITLFEDARMNGGGASLLPTLRPYQKAAVSWMLSREKPMTTPSTNKLKTFAEFPLGDGTQGCGKEAVAYDPFCGLFRGRNSHKEDELMQPAHLDLSCVRGGILADEMGLGKTVEVITLVLCNPWPAACPALLSSHVAPSEASDAEAEPSSDTYDCICGSTEDHESGWVQCTFCQTWHHQVCSGFSVMEDSDGRLPDFIESDNHAAENEYGPESFMCFHCQVTENPQFGCKTTLIVSPESIHDQWETELKRHVKPGALKLLRYPGVKALRARLSSLRGPSEQWQILANGGLTLASYDVVLTTYEALSSDLYHLPTEMTHARRSSTRQKRKRYAFVASPLIFLKFWRVCMDEAQVGVENAQLQAALTVAKLNTEMKWVVTGTPFSTQVGDLYGCFKFLCLRPFDNEFTGATLFQEVIEKCFSKGAIDRVLDILLWDGDDCSSRRARDGGGLLWRTSKKDVLEQLNLPSQVTEIIWCRFSEVERHFYDEQERSIVAAVKEHERQSNGNGDRTLAKRNADVTERVWNDLLTLRQICCHPQVGSTLSAMFSFKGKAASGEMNGGVLSMDEFLQQLIVKCKRECEEGQRKYLAAQNGLASLLVITHDVRAAILKYLSCIQVIKSNWDVFRADLLPRLHILENLTRCVRTTFKIESDGNSDLTASAAQSSKLIRKDLTSLETEMADVSNNPKENSLLPDLPAITQAISADMESGTTASELADLDAIARECDTLDTCANKIKKYYLYQAEASHIMALRSFEAVLRGIDNDVPSSASGSSRPARQVLCSRSLWWLEALVTVEDLSPTQAAHFVDRLRARLLSFGTAWAMRFCQQFTSLTGFRVVFLNELEELHKKRTLLYEKLQALSKTPPTKKDIELSGNCKRCRDGRDGPVCDHCKLYKELETYKQHFLGIGSTSAVERNAFNRLGSNTRTDMYDDDDTVVNASSSNLNASSLLLEIFKEIASSTRSVQRAAGRLSTYDDRLREELDFWARVQKEWNAGKKLFQVQHQRLGALDELEMATMQIRLRLPNEVVVTAAEKLYKLVEFEVPVKFASLESDRVVGEMEMRDKQARLRYLMQLEKQRAKTNDDALPGINEKSNESPRDGIARKRQAVCAVCLEEMENERVMLPCAHIFCKNCMKTLSTRNAATATIKCPTCRRICSASKVVVVFEDGRDVANSRNQARPVRPLADTHIQLKRGGYGSKIDAILRRVLALAQRNSEVKCLLFTQWQDMMDIVATHLRQNGVMCFTYTTKKNFHRVMQQFKVFSEPCVLALPFKVGANGLNLVEATEVLLVEPLLNTSIEAQAINRVHRIGQTKQTRVHRLVVDNSVEERIYWLGQKKSRRKSPTASQSTNDPDSTAAEEEDVERAPTKKEKEKLTFNDLNMLLDGRVNFGGEQRNDDDAPSGNEMHPFWLEQVVLNGRTMTRQDAKVFFERLHAVECRARSESVEDQPRTHLFDRDVNLVVASKVVELEYRQIVDAEQSQSQLPTVSPELLAFHAARIREELEIWTSAAVPNA
ncbi:E3 ubiquitin-protein ligase shprh, partial [Globisporangium splendens]